MVAVAMKCGIMALFLPSIRLQQRKPAAYYNTLAFRVFLFFFFVVCCCWYQSAGLVPSCNTASQATRASASDPSAASPLPCQHLSATGTVMKAPRAPLPFFFFRSPPPHGCPRASAVPPACSSTTRCWAPLSVHVLLLLFLPRLVAASCLSFFFFCGKHVYDRHTT